MFSTLIGHCHMLSQSIWKNIRVVLVYISPLCTSCMHYIMAKIHRYFFNITVLNFKDTKNIKRKTERSQEENICPPKKIVCSFNLNCIIW
jgi:hypothetical protein